MVRARRTGQRELDFPNGWGGQRANAGRKPAGERAGVRHRPRARLASRFPVHVVTRIAAGLPSLRHRATLRALEPALAAGSRRAGFRLVHYSVQTNHLHLLVEAADRVALARGMQGLSIRIAKALNRLWERRGTVFADRYADRILRTPGEVRAALRYVLQNAARHGIFAGAPDPFSSGRWFDGWRERVARAPGTNGARPVQAARTWLLSVGWRRCGLVGLREYPPRKGPPPPGRAAPPAPPAGA